MRYLLAILFFGALVAIYIVLYLMNKKTPKPEGCEDLKGIVMDVKILRALTIQLTIK